MILQIPGPVRRWIDQICAWDFTRVISAHFNAPVDATPADLRQGASLLIKYIFMRMQLRMQQHVHLEAVWSFARAQCMLSEHEHNPLSRWRHKGNCAGSC